MTLANNFRVLHACDETGADAGTVLRQLAAAVGAPPPRQLPALLARMAGVPAELPAPVRTDGARLRRLLPQWQLRYPTFAHGAAQMRAFWASVPSTRHLVKN